MSDELTPAAVLEAAEPVTQQSTGEPTDQVTGVQDTLSTGSAEGEGEVATPYTDEEVVAILEQDGALDAKRLTPTQKLVQRSFEKGVTRKFEEAARIKSNAEEQVRQVQAWQQQVQQAYQQQSNPEVWAFQQYMQNPHAVISDINATIAQLETVSPYEEDSYKQARANIAKLQAYKDTFREQREALLSNQFMLHQSKQAMDAEFAKLPDFAAIAPQMEQYAVQKLGLLPQDIAFLKDPAVPYGLGTRLIKALYGVYKDMNAAKLKEIKAPPALGRPGSPTGPAAGGETPPDNPVEFRKWWKERHGGK